MTKKRLIESKELSEKDTSTIKLTRITPITFDEVAAIIQSGNSEKLKELIESGRITDINMNNDDNESLLMIACKSGFIECAIVLIDNHANINYQNCDHNTPGDISFGVFSDSVLISACLSGNVNMLRVIVERGVTFNDGIICDLFKSDEIVCNNEIATALVGYIQNVNWKGGIKSSFLSLACRAGNVTIARLLIERGALLGDVYAFVIASQLGHLEVVKLLLKWVDSGIPPVTLKDALRFASKYGHLEVVRCLLEYVKDTDALNRALYEAVENNRLDIAGLLFDSGVGFTSSSAVSYITVWLVACLRGSPDMVSLFLDRGADPNAVDANGGSPFRAALPHPNILRILLEHGADPSRALDGCTPLLALLQRRPTPSEYMQSVAVLLEYGADPNIARADTGETVLMVAALDLDVDLIKLLLEHGADVTQINTAGETVLDMLGRTRKYGEVVNLCTQYIECNKPGAKLLLK